MPRSKDCKAGALMRVSMAAIVLLSLFMVGCRTPGAGSGRITSRPLYELDIPEEPIQLLAVEGRGGVTFTLRPRAPWHLVAPPLGRAEKGKIVRLAFTESWCNLGYMPPRDLDETEVDHCAVEWVLAAPDQKRKSGVTRLRVEILPNGEMAVLEAANQLDH